MTDVKNSKNLLKREIGDKLTKAFKKRLEQIKSFSNFFSFVNTKIDNTELLKGDLSGYYSMTLDANYRIIISPETSDLSTNNLKGIDSFKIIGVIDYHGKGNKNTNWLIH